MFSKMAQAVTGNILMVLEAEKRKIEGAGGTVINLSAGTPDLPPDVRVMETLARESLNPENYRYAISDSPELTEAAAAWYKRRFSVDLLPEQITSVYGSQEGLTHIAFPLCDPGDIVLVPDPGYPIFSFGPAMAGARVCPIPLKRENGFIMDLDAIDPALADKARLMIVSYPNNPCTARATPEFYEKLVRFAKRHDIFVIHDNAYCELVLDGEPGGSFLAVEGASDIGIEFNSLSKSYNLTGMRMSFALGNRKVIEAFKTFRSQIDYGPFVPIQKAAIAAITGPQDILDNNRRAYRERRDALCAGLREIGWPVPNCDSTMFTWFPLPDGYTDDVDFTFKLLRETGIICVPGSSFGEMGKGFLRFALVQPVPVLKRAVELIRATGIIGGGKV